MEAMDSPTLKELEGLNEFLSLFAAEVLPHAREELTAEQKDALRRLAAGELSDAERRELVPLLAKNEAAMEYLAEIAG